MKSILIIVLIIFGGIELGGAAIDSLQSSSTSKVEEISEAPSYSEGIERNELNYYAGFSKRLALGE